MLHSNEEMAVSDVLADFCLNLPKLIPGHVFCLVFVSQVNRYSRAVYSNPAHISFATFSYGIYIGEQEPTDMLRQLGFIALSDATFEDTSDYISPV